ncbi:glycoside hydrolase family 16 protein [Sclerotinia borealis F-4128]|uniref:Glycoside hydrolase family 16 protein n=1 Tax=Sclerotinia borealis (strain F-4128) TaxID=1432307 RepID=W9C784_SCLBF|nr:glycoside hydrolase family 16 protein [Sclerotinia borealis F-4128]
MKLFSLPPIPLALFFTTLTVLAQKDNGEECSCFRTDSASSGYFTYHRFHDFRTVATASQTVPELISNEGDSSSAVVTSDFFSGSAWNNDWSTQSWNNSDSMKESGSSVLMVNSPNNVYIETSTDNDTSYDTYLTLRTARLENFQSVAEFDSNERNFKYLSARFLARVIGSEGACAGIFTYLNSNPIQEADIEILTSGPRNVVQYTNQPSLNKAGDADPRATSNASTADGGMNWSVWNTYRMDWMPKQTSWYINGESVANITYQVPKSPSGLILNMWSDGGEWTGNMSLFDEAFLQFQWIEIVYNTSGEYAGSKRELETRKDKGCQVVCGVDEGVNVTGTPVMLINNTNLGTLGWKEGSGSMGWIPVVVVGLVLFGWF